MKEISNSDFDFMAENLETIARLYSRQAHTNHESNIAGRMIQIAKKLNRKKKTDNEETDRMAAHTQRPTIEKVYSEGHQARECKTRNGKHPGYAQV